MKVIGVFDAKTRFSEIAQQVKESGQAVRITKRGEEMVDITPIPSRPAGRRSREQAFAALAELRHTLPKTTLKQIKADIALGRR